MDIVENINTGLDTFTVNNQNARLLVDLRSKIDGANSDKLIKESHKFANDPSCRAVILLQGQLPVGYVELTLDEELPIEKTDELVDAVHLSRLGVVKEMRGKGFGKRLVRCSEEWAVEKGKRGVWLEYRDDNLPARKLYDSMGFITVGNFTKEGVKRTVAFKSVEPLNSL